MDLCYFSGKYIITATNATTKIYKGVSSFTEGEDRPEGLAAAIFAAATEQQWEGSVTTAAEDVPAGRWHGKKLTLTNGAAELFTGAIIHSASADIEGGRLSLDFGALGWLSAGDFMDLQRLMNRRAPKWVSPQERTSNALGATDHGSGQGDNVGGFDQPSTTVVPGGSEPIIHQWKTTKKTATTLDVKGGTLTSQTSFAATTIADVTNLSATESGHVILTIYRNSSTRAVTGTPAITFAAGALPTTDEGDQIIPLAKVTVTGSGDTLGISEILPLKFEELHIFEEVCVVNGEFRFGDFLMASRNLYELPAP